MKNKAILYLSIIIISYGNLQANGLSWSVKSTINNIRNIEGHITKSSNSFEDSRKLFFRGEEKIILDTEIVTSKSSAARVDENVDGISDDLILYDYNKDVSDEKLPVRKLSETDEAIKDYVYDYTVENKSCQIKEQNHISHVYEVSIMLTGIGLDGFREDINNFEVTYLDDKNEYLTSDSKGEIKIGGNEILSRTQTARHIKIFSSDYFPLSTKLDISNERLEVNLPMMKNEKLDNILEKDQIPSYEGLLLVNIDDSVEFVNIDRPYKKKIYLDENYNAVTEETETILFAGVELGNTELIIEHRDKTINKNLIHLKTEEMYYFYYERDEVRRFDLEVCQKELLASDKLILSVSGNKIEHLNSELSAEKVGVNRYQFTRSSNTGFQKDYLIFKHLSEEVLVASNGFNYVELPSQSYLNYLVNDINLENHGCTIQLNFSNNVAEMFVEGYTGLGYIPFEIISLDSMGIFDREVNLDTQKAFIKGEGEGVFNIKIIYSNDSVDYIESFCGPGTYSVEQL